MPLATLLLSLFLPFVEGSPLQTSQGQSPLQFLGALQQAVSRGDRQAVSAMMRYPLDVFAAGLQIPVSNAAAFVKLYDSVISPEIKDVIARARVPPDGTIVPGIVRSPSGSISFDNAVTIGPVGDGFRVTRIAVPTGGRGSGSAEAQERKLTFRAGQPTQASGSLAAGGRDRFVFYARRGVFVEVRLTGVPGNSVLVRLLHADTGEPVDARANTGTRVWSGRMSADATYRIEVVRQPDSGKDPLIYTLTVAVK